MAKVIITGCSWYLPEQDDIALVLVESGFRVTEVVVSGKMGAAQIAEDWARARLTTLTSFKMKQSFSRTNAEMVTYADALLAFWDGHGADTADMIRKMIEMKKPVWIEMIRPIPEDEL